METSILPEGNVHAYTLEPVHELFFPTQMPQILCPLHNLSDLPALPVGYLFYLVLTFLYHFMLYSMIQHITLH